MPRITIGVSTYNRRDYLRESLKSLLNQTWKDYEIIVVDDGSTDQTDIMMQAEFPQVKYFRKENGGDASAKNFAAEKADSEFLVFNDSDDLFYPDTLTTLITPLQINPAACAYGNYMRIDAAGNELPTKRKLDYSPSGWIMPLLVEHIFIAGGGCMMPLKSFHECGGYPEDMPVGHDYKLNLELSLKHPFFGTDNNVFKRRRHDGNISSGSYQKLKILNDMVTEFCERHTGEQGLTREIVERRMAKYHNNLAREARKEHMPHDVIKQHLQEALRLNFSLKTLGRLLFW